MSASINRMRDRGPGAARPDRHGGHHAGLALWPADAAQSEARTWIRDGDSDCRYVPVSEALNARPCQS